MRNIFIIVLFAFILLSGTIPAIAQHSSSEIKYTNKDSSVTAKNPFKKFIGEWGLKNDEWFQNWGGKDEQIKIINHHTLTTDLNTANSLLSIIDGVPPYGHIFWSYNPAKKEVDHLSSFGTMRAGVGKGTVNENGDVFLKIVFADEAPGSYRQYSYTWISPDEYKLWSVQYDENNKPTGLFYGGVFVRISKDK